MVIGNIRGKRVAAVKQQILTYIWDRKLAFNARLPVQTEMCKIFDASTATVSRAINILVEEGVLTSKRGVGVLVKEPRPTGHPGWVIGLAGSWAKGFNFSVTARTSAAEDQLHRHGCRCILFPHQEISPDYYQELSVSTAPGLTEALSRHELNGVMTASAFRIEEWEKIEASGVKLCYFGPSVSVPCGVLLDIGWFVEQGLRELLATGVKRPRIMIGPLGDFLKREILAAVARIRDEFPRIALPPDRELLLTYDYQNFLDNNYRQWARDFLAIAPAARPDGLVLCDDVMANGFFAELVRRQVNNLQYLPRAICMQNRGLGMELPLRKVTIYWADLYEMGRQATELLLGRLSEFSPRPPEIIHYHPVRQEIEYF